MNPDPVYQKYLEISWRRPLSDPEKAELRAWLINHPEAQAAAEVDALLTAALTKLPDAPVPSNFTARVMQTIEREGRLQSRVETASRPWWRAWLPRLAPVAIVLIGCLVIWQQQQHSQHQALTEAAREVASAQILADPNVMTHFDEIVSLASDSAAPDEGLLSMSDDLIALSK